MASDVPVPSCGPREVLVRVAAASVGSLRLSRAGGVRPRRCTSRCSRWCSAATSAARSWARGDAARAFPLGAAVFGALSPVAPRGTHAEYVAVPEAHLARVPPGWSHIERRRRTLRRAHRVARALHHRQPPPGRATPRTRRGRRRRRRRDPSRVRASVPSRRHVRRVGEAGTRRRRRLRRVGLPIRRLPDRSRENTRLGAVRCRVGLRRGSQERTRRDAIAS